MIFWATFAQILLHDGRRKHSPDLTSVKPFNSHSLPLVDFKKLAWPKLRYVLGSEMFELGMPQGLEIALHWLANLVFGH